MRLRAHSRRKSNNNKAEERHEWKRKMYRFDRRINVTANRPTRNLRSIRWVQTIGNGLFVDLSQTPNERAGKQLGIGIDKRCSTVDRRQATHNMQILLSHRRCAPAAHSFFELCSETAFRLLFMLEWVSANDLASCPNTFNSR